MNLSVTLLMFNEAKSIGSVLNETTVFCKENLDEFEIIVVDDGSTDGSAEIVLEQMEREPCIQMVSHPVNRGMGAGIRTAIAHAEKEHFVFNAADGQIPAAEIAKLLPCLSQADMVLSTYKNRRTLGRELLSRGFRAYLRILAGIGFGLQGLYIVPTQAAKEIAPLIQANTFFFSFELIQRCLDQGLTTATCEITCHPRLAGASKVLSVRRIARVGLEAARFGIGNRVHRGGAIFK